MLVISSIINQDVIPQSSCDYSQLSRQIVSSLDCTFRLETDYKQLNHYDNTTFDETSYDFSVVNMNYLTPIQLDNQDCIFSGLYGLDYNASLKNGVVIVDADIDLAGLKCSNVYVSLFDNILGTMNNITTLGEVRIYNSTDSQIVTVSDMFGYAYSNSSIQNQFANLSANVEFKKISTESTNVSITPVHYFDSQTIQVTQAENLTSRSDVISQYGTLRVTLPYSSDKKSYIAKVYSALGFQNQGNSTSSEIKLTAILNYFYSFINLMQMNQWTQNCKTINMFIDGENLTYDSSKDYFSTIYSCPNVTYFTKTGKNNEGVLGVCTGNNAGYLDIQELECVASCSSTQLIEGQVCYPETLSCPFSLNKYSTTTASTCIYECQRFKNLEQALVSNVKVCQTPQQSINDTDNCQQYLYAEACYDYCPYGVKIDVNNMCQTPNNEYCRTLQQYLLVRTSLPTICVDYCPEMLLKSNDNTCKTPCVGTNCQSDCNNSYVVQFPIRQDNNDIYCADKCNNFTIAQNQQYLCQYNCDESYLMQYQIGQCVQCLETQFWDRNNNECTMTCEYYNITKYNNDQNQYRICEQVGDENYCPRTTTLDNGTKQCIFECDGDLIGDADGNCISNCTTNTDGSVFVNEAGNQCTSSCEQQKVFSGTLGYQCIGDSTNYYTNIPPYISEVLEEKYLNYTYYHACQDSYIVAYTTNGYECISDPYGTEQASNYFFKNITLLINGISVTNRTCYQKDVTAGLQQNCPLGQKMNGTYWCTTNCTNGLVNQTYTCQQECTENYKIDDSTNQCIETCTTNFYQKTQDAVAEDGQPSNKQRAHCITGCSTAMIKSTTDEYECSTTCSANSLYTNQQYKMRYNNICVPNCTYYTQGSENICEETSSQQRNETNCPFYEQVSSTSNYKCLQNCPQGTVYYESGSNKQQCLASCNNDFYNQQQTICYTECPTQYYSQGSRNNTNIYYCISSCSQFAGNGTKSTTKQQCESTCEQINSGYRGIQSGLQKTCTESCPTGQKYYQNNLCSSNCTGTNIYPNIEDVQNSSSKSWTCMVCNSNQQQTTSDGIRACQACPSNQFTKITYPAGTLDCSSTCNGQNELKYMMNNNIIQCLVNYTCYDYRNNANNMYQDMKYTSDDQCVSDCTGTNMYLDVAGKNCTNSCGTINTYQLTSDGMEQCHTCTYYRDMGSNSYLCDECKNSSNTIWDNTLCKTTPCYLENKYSIKQDSYTFCVDKCSNNNKLNLQYYYDASLMICIADCSNSNITYDETQPYAFLYDQQQEKQCVNSCPNSLQYYTYVGKLSSESQENVYQCMNQCATDKPFKQGLYKGDVSTGKYECVQSCTGEGIYIQQSTGICDLKCMNIDQSLKYYYIGQDTVNYCVQRCETDQLFLQSYPGVQEKQCIENCTYATSLSSSEVQSSGAAYQCQSQCPNYNEEKIISYSSGHDPATITIQRCVDSCTVGVVDNRKNIYIKGTECVDKCDTNQYIQEQTCTDTCSQQYATDKSNKVCSLTCSPYVVVENAKECVQNCKTIDGEIVNYYYQEVQNRYQCVEECSNHEYNIIGGKNTCQTCDNYKILKDNVSTSYQCTTSCDTSIYSIVNEYCWNGECKELQDKFPQDDSLNSMIYTTSDRFCSKQCSQLYQKLQSSNNQEYYSCITSQECGADKVFIDEGLNKLCTTQCQDNYYISGSTADTYSGIRKCVLNCPTLNQDQSGRYLYADIQENVKLCSAQCQSGYYKLEQENHICEANQCNTFIQENNIKQCVQQCPQDHPYKYQVEQQMQCLRSSCAGLFIDQQNTCVTQCQSKLYKQQQDGSLLCISTCDQYQGSFEYQEQLQCIENCSIYSDRFIIEISNQLKWCNTTCSQEKPFMSTIQQNNNTIQICISTCPLVDEESYYYIKYLNGSQSCVTQCEDEQKGGAYASPMLYDNDTNIVCESICPEEQPYYDQQQNCVEDCGVGYYAQDARCQISCDGQQASFTKQLENRSVTICVSSCYDNNMFLKINQASTQKYQCSECGSQFYRKNNGEYECVQSCQENEFYNVQETIFDKEISQCVTQCPSKIYIQKQCIDEKQTCRSQDYLFQIEIDGFISCTSGCTQELPVLKSPTDMTCVQACQQGQVLDISNNNYQICRDNCDDDGLILFADSQLNKCVSDCYFTLNEQQKKICTQQYSSCDGQQRQIKYSNNNTVYCQTVCQDYVQQLETEYLCMDSCYTQYYQMNNETNEKICSTSCQEPDKYHKKINNQLSACISTCGQMYLQQQDSTQCIQQCQSQTYKQINGEKVCQESLGDCEIYQLVINLYECIDTCEQVIENKLCQEKCSQKNQYLNIEENNQKVCHNYCTTQKFVIESGISKCIETCPESYSAQYTSVGGYLQCKDSCNGCLTFVDNDNYCHYNLPSSQCYLTQECSDDDKLIIDNVCQSKDNCKDSNNKIIYDGLSKVCISTVKQCSMYYQTVGSDIKCINYCDIETNLIYKQDDGSYECKSKSICQQDNKFVEKYQCVVECSSKIVNEEEQCLDDLSYCQHYYIDQQKITNCVSECPTQSPNVLPISNNGQCVSSCNPQFNANNKCTEICPEDKNFYAEYVCQESCDGYQYYQINQYGKLCLDSCTMKQIYINSSISRCISSCPTGYYTQGAKCVNSCDQNFVLNEQLGVCSTKCQVGEYYLTQIGQENKYVCTAQVDCSFYSENNVSIQNTQYILCKDQCSTTPKEYIVNKTYCVQQCPMHAQYISTDSIPTCTSLCRSMEYLSVSGNTCLFNCPEDQFKQLAISNDTNNQCKTECTQVQDEITMTCLQSASTCEYAQYKENSDVLVCVASCQQNIYIIQGQVKQCLEQCDTKYFVQLGEQIQCQNECSNGMLYYQPSNSTLIQCVSNCNLYNQFNDNGTCTSQCSEGYETYIDSCVPIIKQDSSWFNYVIIAIVVFVVIIIAVVIITQIRRKKRHQQKMQQRRTSNIQETQLYDNRQSDIITGRSQTKSPKKMSKSASKQSIKHSSQKGSTHTSRSSSTRVSVKSSTKVSTKSTTKKTTKQTTKSTTKKSTQKKSEPKSSKSKQTKKL